MFQRVSYILDKTQKIKLLILLFIIFVGAFVELLGVSSILPLINVAVNPEIIDETWYLRDIYQLMGFQDAKQMLLFLSVALIVIYILKNIYISFMYNLQYRFIFNNQRRLAVKMMDAYMHQSYLFHVSRNVAEYSQR